MRIAIASLAAVAVQPLVFFVRIAPDYFAAPAPMYGVGVVVMGIVVVGAAVVMLLGIPTYLILRKAGRTNWPTIAFAGASLGALPTALFWPRHLEGYSSGQNWHGNYVETYINGIPTQYAWLNYGESILYFGIHGLVGALSFHATWRALESKSKSPEHT
jgi:hypothetical protein